MPGPGGRLDAVLVCGGRWHDFDYARYQLLGLLGEREQVRTRVFADYSVFGALERADLLISYTCDVRPTAAEQDALASFVSRGGRWLALHGTHSAIDPPSVPGGVYRTPRVLGRFAEVLGGQFLAHPPIAPYTVQVTAPSHPLVAGLGRSRCATSCTSASCTHRSRCCCTRGSPASAAGSRKGT